jgi:hypothetical protein
MNRTNRLLIVVLLLQVGVAAALSMSRERGGIARSEPVFPALKTSEVSRIEIRGAKGTAGASGEPGQAVLEKDGATWRLAGSGYPADQKKVGDFLDRVTKLRARGPVVTSTQHYRTLEVADDAYERQVKLASTDKPIAFLLGKSAGPEAAHLRKDGASEVLRVEGLDVWSVGDRPSQWIDPVYVKVDPAELWALTVENKSGKYRLEKNDAGEWRLADQGKGEEVDKTTVDDIVHGASSINLEEPVGRTMAPEQGLASPAAKVTLTTGKGEGGKRPAQTKDISLLVGNHIDAGSRYYARSSDSEFVVQVAEFGVKRFLEKGRRDLVKH